MLRTRLAAVALAATAASVAAGIAATGPATASSTIRPQASAGGPGHWSEVTTAYHYTNSFQFEDIGLARGSDGVLHVVWASPGATRTHEVLDTPISASGKVGRAVVLASGIEMPLSTNLVSVYGLDATATPHGIDAFWITQNGDEGIEEYSRPLKGGHWSFATIVRPLAGDTGYGSSVAATTGSDSKPWTGFFAVVSGTRFVVTVQHAGHPQREILPDPECCVLGPAFGLDGRTGTTWIAYQSIGTRPGTFAQRLAADGATTGSKIFLPHSAIGSSILPVNQRVAVTGRGHGQANVYAAYAAFTGQFVDDVDLIRLGATKPLVLFSAPHSGEIAGVALSATPKGALWATWIEGYGLKPALFVRESNNQGARFGRTVKVTLPSGTTAVHEVYTSAQASRLDILVLLDRGGKTAYWATQVK
jgi:hypothetical protein